MLLSLLSYCCRNRHHHQYDTDQKSLRTRLIGSDTTHNQYVSTIALPSYNINTNDFYQRGKSYVIARQNIDDVYFFPNKPRSTTSASHIISDNPAEHIKDTIVKNYIINKTKNYYIKRNLLQKPIPHNQKIQTFSKPITATIEKQTDHPHWKNENPLLFRQNIKNEQQSKVQQDHPISSNLNKKLAIKHHSKLSNDMISFTTSEMSGHDSETIYGTIPVFIPKQQLPLQEDDEYKTTGIDEVEFKIEDLIRLQKTHNTYSDILLSTNMARKSTRSSPSTNV
ncbi:unnamed protein product [Adineta steineri]|uniref:Uncharacterized protein n=1 Tax=Adineta steineri TaxID=433720 RepID=A0A814FHK3_9BILA|nr:unnamed protein product [Adineta steineri]CAF3834997.1 unnamed protein product [Adineta steineri]